MGYVFGFVKHRPTGETFAVRFASAGEIAGAYGPLHPRAACLGAEGYPFIRSVGEMIQANFDDYEIIYPSGPYRCLEVV